MAQEFKTFSLLTLDKTFDRANGQPLDNTSVWYIKTDAENYAKSNKAYVGQIISVISNTDTAIYQIINTQGELQKVGQSSQGGGGQSLQWGSFN